MKTDGGYRPPMPTKPPSLIYGVGDRPPLPTSLLLGLQHVVVMTAGWVMVVVIATAIGASHHQVTNVLRMSMIASGIATILQSLRTRIGSGYLCPVSGGPPYISASILAGRAGGLSLVFTMTLLSGVFEALASRLLPRLRVLFPPEVTGLVVTMVGLELVVLGCPRFFGVQGAGVGLDPRTTAVGTLALAAMIAPTVWGRGRIRLYPLLIGLAAGYAGAFGLRVVDTSSLQQAFAAPMFGIPHKVAGGWAFDFAVLPAFLIASLASTLKGVGDLTLCQKITDANWKRTDMRSVSGGVLASAIGTGLAGLLGGIGQSTYSSNVGLSLATGAASRSIAIPCGVLMALLAFLPKLAAVFAAMPDPVMGAVLIYVACYMIVAGIQVITSRMLDARRTFVVGIALIFGLSVYVLPGLYANVPGAIQPLFSSALALSTILVVVLHVLFRIGIAQRQVLLLTPGQDSSEAIVRFMETHGSIWGARREVIQRATAALNELLETAVATGLSGRQLEITVRFDEFDLDVEVCYDGKPIPLASVRPTEADLLADESALAALAGFLVRQYADRVESDEVDGRCRIRLHFDH